MDLRFDPAGFLTLLFGGGILAYLAGVLSGLTVERRREAREKERLEADAKERAEALEKADLDKKANETRRKLLEGVENPAETVDRLQRGSKRIRAGALEFYDVKSRQKFSTGEWRLETKTTKGKTRYFAVTKAPSSGREAWLIVSREFAGSKMHKAARKTAKGRGAKKVGSRASAKRGRTKARGTG